MCLEESFNLVLIDAWTMDVPIKFFGPDRSLLIILSFQYEFISMKTLCPVLNHYLLNYVSSDSVSIQ